MSDASVLFDVQDCVALITLNEGDRMNPLSEAIQAGLLQSIARVHENKIIRAALLTGNGRGFCVGADLQDLSKRSRDIGPHTLGGYVGQMMEEGGNRIITGLRSLPVPLICAVNGAAAGGGVGLALAADMVIAASSAYFYLPFVPALGIVPDMGASWLLPRTAGRARAMGLALTGEKLPAQTAAEWGLIWASVDDAQLLPEAMRLAQQLAATPSDALVEIRSLFTASEQNSIEQQLDLERRRQEVLIDGDSFAEGVKAFGERRKPVFRGRT